MLITPDKLAAAGTESAHQSALFCWAASCGKPELKMLVAIPNGGLRDKITASRMKATGTKAGFPDMFLFVPRGGFCGLAIELKIDSGRIGPKQEEWRNALREQNYQAVVAYGWNDAKVILENYLKL